MNKLENLKREFDVIELEERLEMVQLMTAQAEEASNGCCCGSDGSCKPAPVGK
jgi:hypothetical protein